MVGFDKINAGEYKNYSEIKDIFGEDILKEDDNDWNGIWMESDRLARNERWKNAMETITKNKWTGVLKPFYQVSDYYLWCQWKAEGLGHEIQWAKGAAYLVDDLGDGFETNQSVVTTGNILDKGERLAQSLLSDLNLGILDYAITRFNDLFYGTNAINILKGDAAYYWDKDFITHEQVIVAWGVYPRYDGTKELEFLKEITRKELGNDGAGYFSQFFSRLVPDFSLIGVDVSKGIGRYGEYGRVHIPLFMLWPYRHDASLDVHINGGVTVPSETGTCLTGQVSGKLITTYTQETDAITTPGKRYDCIFAGQCIDANTAINNFYSSVISKF